MECHSPNSSILLHYCEGSFQPHDDKLVVVASTDEQRYSFRVRIRVCVHGIGLAWE